MDKKLKTERVERFGSDRSERASILYDSVWRNGRGTMLR